MARDPPGENLPQEGIDRCGGEEGAGGVGRGGGGEVAGGGVVGCHFGVEVEVEVEIDMGVRWLVWCWGRGDVVGRRCSSACGELEREGCWRVVVFRCAISRPRYEKW